MTEELYQFLACDYYATGEGRTVCLLVTRVYPRSDDYETHGDIVDGVWVPSTLKNSAKFRAAREFVEEFGGWYAQGAENLTREEFLERFGHYLPDFLKKLLTNEEQPGNLNFKQKFHLNFS
jgi:hypothetical protein